MDILTYGLLNKKVEEAKNISGEKITEAVNTYLDKNPVAPGATSEQAAQIQDNTNKISELNRDLAYLYVNVKSFGAVGDGVTDDSNAFIDALNFSKRVYIPKGTYALNKIINIDSHVRLVGAGINETILLVRNGYGIHHVGTSVNSDNPEHATYFYVSDLTIKSNAEPSTSPMMLLKCSSYTVMDRVRFSGQGTQLKMLEAFDSRFNDCIFEYGGSKLYSTPGVLLCSKIESCEMTNSIVFNGCRFESFYGEAVSTQGNDTNTITFANCKFESRNIGYTETDEESAKNGLVFYNAMSLFFRDCYFCSPLRSEASMLVVNLCKGVTITGTFTHTWEKDSTVVDIINPLFLQQCSRNIILELNFFNSFDGNYPEVPITINDTTVTRGFVNGIEI